MRALRGHRSVNVKPEGTARRPASRATAASAATAVVAGSLAVASWVGVGLVAADETGTTATVCQSVPMQLTNWSSTVALPKFDPSLGTLTKVTITATLLVEGSGKAESRDAAPSVVVANVSATGTLSVPGALPQSVNPTIGQSFNATAFDGTIDYAGTSGFSTGVLTTYKAFPAVELTGDAAASYVGPGTFTASGTATGLSNASGPGNVVQEFTTKAQADVCVAYAYLVPPTTTTTTTLPPTTTSAPTTTVVEQLVPTTGETPGGLLPATGRTSRTVVWPAAFFTIAGVAVLRLVRRRPAVD